jgi:hypothetical protein
MKGRFLTQLRKAAILASVVGAPDNEPAEPCRDVLSQGLGLSDALCPQLQEGQELGQVDETFGFPSLLNAQLLTSVLTIEQIVQAFVHSPRKLEAFQISGELELDEDLLRHADPFEAVAGSPFYTVNPHPRAATQGRPYSRYRYASVVRNGTKSPLSTSESRSSTAWRRWPWSGPPNAWSSWSRISR